jgi:hypothetical protein
MLTFAQALELAETWIRIVTGDQAIVVKEDTLKRPYGWVSSKSTPKSSCAWSLRARAINQWPSSA